MSIPAPRWWLSDGRNEIIIKLKPVDGLHSTAMYLLKEDNFPIQTSKRYHVFGEKRQSYVWSIDHTVKTPRLGVGCPMVAIIVISKPVDGLHSTAI